MRFTFLLSAMSVVIALQGNTTTFKIATTAPDGTALMVELREAAKVVDERTEGNVKFKFYTGGVMGDDFTVKRKIRARQLHGGIVQTSVYVNDIPNLNLYSLPMLFRNHEEVTEVRSQLDSLLMNELEESGVVPIGFTAVGFAYAMGTKQLGTIQQIRRSKVWTPKDDPIAKQNLKVFGITPIPLPVGDVLTGLQTGLIDTIASPPVAAIALQWHTQVKYMLDIPLQYVYTIYSIDQRMFNRLSESHQEVVLSEMSSALTRAEKQLIEEHDEAFEVMLEEGVELVTPDTDALAEWRKLSQDAIIEWLENDQVDRESYELIEEALEQFRNEHSQ